MGPGLMMGFYLISSTSVSEFIAAMERIHIPKQIIIPFSVMFRFFPTIKEEMSSINAAMKMRDIRFGKTKGNPISLIEYRLVPLFISCVKIGQERRVQP
jgi:energy-coupling factor transport system permease protein